MTIPIIAKFQKAFVGAGGLMDAVDVDNSLTGLTGILNGATNQQNVNTRLDGTGLGTAPFNFAGDYSAQNSNITEWYNNLAQTHLIGQDNQANARRAFALPGTLVLATVFDGLVAKGLPEVFRMQISYLGGESTSALLNALVISPRVAPAPAIDGRTNVTLARGESVTLEIRRVGGTLSNYTVISEGAITTIGGGSLDDIELQTVTWNAAENAALPTTVLKGYAFRVINAPADGSGRFDEVMQNDDWVVWFGESFVQGTTDWTTEPHEWFVIAGHDVRRLTATGQNFLESVTQTTVRMSGDFISDQTADALVWLSPGVFTEAPFLTPSADTNNPRSGQTQTYVGGRENKNSDDQFTFNEDRSLHYIYVGITTQFADNNDHSTIDIVVVDGTREVARYNLADNFRAIPSSTEWPQATVRHFVYDNDGTSQEAAVNYTANNVIQIVLGTESRGFTLDSDTVDLTQNIKNLQRDQLAQDIQTDLNAIRSVEPWESAAAVLFSGAIVHDTSTTDRVEYAEGYSRGVDWRDMTESTTINANRYLDSALSISVNLAAFTVTGFGATLQKVAAIKLQRNDSNTGTGALVEIGSGQAFIRVNTLNQVQVNANVGGPTADWQSLSAGGANPPTIGAGNNNALIFEMLPRSTAGSWEFVSVLFDGTTYTQLNNINFTPTGLANGDNLGFSRSSSQRGQVTTFKAINSPGYLTHSQLESLLRQHIDDKWDFGFARLIQGSNSAGVAIRHLLLESPNGTFYRLSVNDDGSLKTDEVT